ncbi:MAG: OmpH family outer membrane protein [Polaribacter sp.]
MKSKLLFFCIAFISITAFSQTKTGTVDSDYIISIMPETKIVFKRANDYGAKLDTSYTKKLDIYKAKLDTYRTNEKTMGELAKKTSISEIQTLEADLNKYRENGRKLIQLKRDELMRPLYKKLSDAIVEVSKANGYTQVLTVTGNQFAYADPKFDITELVMKKLGVKAPEPAKK